MTAEQQARDMERDESLAEAMREQHDIVACGNRYRWLRARALDAKLGLEYFVAMEQLDHIGDASKIDATIDAAMLKGSEATPTPAGQAARDMLERLGVENAQNISDRELVMLANMYDAKTPPPH